MKARKAKPLAIQVMERSRAKGTARLVLIGYAFFGNPDGTSITASPAEVARRAGVRPNTVADHRPGLIALGELVPVRGAHGKHVAYAIVLPEQDRATPDPERRQDQAGRDSGVTAHTRGQDPEGGGDSKLPPPRRLERPRADVDQLCELLAALVVENGTPARRVRWPSTSWRRAGRLLLDLDRREPAEAERLIRWCQADEFWRANVLGMPAFRDKYDRLRLHAARVAGSANGRSHTARGSRSATEWNELADLWNAEEQTA